MFLVGFDTGAAKGQLVDFLFHVVGDGVEDAVYLSDLGIGYYLRE
jgi:hypothetical protein